MFATAQRGAFNEFKTGVFDRDVSAGYGARYEQVRAIYAIYTRLLGARLFGGSQGVMSASRLALSQGLDGTGFLISSTYVVRYAAFVPPIPRFR